ncbi:hypothetical protein KQX54_018231 [Cotesia glomerata]|uniref:Uncharacterized protein n=1 Tax=Cotesia glomerata TaxID=32391 RepID=A0AAV7IB29_COTGL|nr:hypothetical protein KQX54_018231 [Cotesia glomerata]
MTAPAKKSSVESLPDRIFKDPDTDLYYSYQATRESGQRKFFLCSLNHSHGCNGQGTLDSDGVFRYLDEKTRMLQNTGTTMWVKLICLRMQFF